MITGGECVTRILQAQGIGSVFALAGASHTYLLDPLDRAGFNIISNRHESGCVGSADGYARATQNLGVALIVSEQGLANAIGGLAVAWNANSPVLVIAAAPPKTYAEADAAIDQDKLALVAPITKWARTVPDASRLEDYVRTAIRHAISGRPGPVLLIVPQDQFLADLPESTVSPVAVPSPQHPDPEAIERAADLLAAAERPLVVVGAGACRGSAGEALATLCYQVGAPILGNGLGRGVVAEDGQRSFSWPYAQIAARDADCVLVVGARLTQRLGFGLPPRFSASAKFIQIDVSAEAFHRNRPIDVAIQAHSGAACTALVAALEKRGTGFDGSWVAERLVERDKKVAELRQEETDPIHPLALADAIAERLPEKAIYVGDGADIQNWMYGAVQISHAPGFMDHYPMGAMGSGTPLAVGAAAALKEQAEREGNDAPPVVLVTGDGSIGFYAAELHAAALANLNLIVVVGNDAAWGTELHGQIEAIGRTINTELGTLPYEKLSESFGCLGLRVDSHAELAPALDAAFTNDGPALVNVCIDPTAGATIKSDERLRMILFSDLLDGQASLGDDST